MKLFGHHHQAQQFRKALLTISVEGTADTNETERSHNPSVH
jgi:hypothetical protein